MRNLFLSAESCLLAMCVFGLIGCGKGDSGAPANTSAATHTHSHSHGHGHGPHGGHVVALDTQSYHAELTLDAASHRVGIHLLGDDAATVVPIEAASVMIEVLDDSRPAEYILAAVSQPGDAPGKSSYFELDSEQLYTIVSGASPSQGSSARISLTVDGNDFSGMIEPHLHDHDYAATHGHSHADDDALVWRKEIREQGFEIALGHHGTTLLAGAQVEPAVKISRDGRPVANARVFNLLLDADGETILAKEVATVYEPPMSDEPAHYAQGALKIPAGTREAVIRYRILLPTEGEHTFDVPVIVK